MVFKNWLYTFLTAGSLAVTGFITSVVVARGLGAEGRGLLANIMLIATLSASLAQLGLGQAIVYMARAFPEWNIKRFFFISLSFIIVCGSLISFSNIYHFRHLNISLVLPTVVLAAALSANGFTTSAMQVEPTLVAYNAVRLAVPATLMTFIAGLFFIEVLSVEKIVWAHCIAAALTLSLTFLWFIKKFPSTSFKTLPYFAHFREYLTLGMKYHANNVMGLALNNLDKVYFFLVGGLREFGVYSVAFGTSRLIGNVQEALSTVIFSRFAGSNSKDLTENTLRAFRLTFVPTLLLATLLAFIASPIFRWIFGAEFALAALPFSLLTFECTIASSGWILAQQFNADGRPGLVLFRQLIAIVPLLSMLPFIPRDNLAPWLAGLLLCGALIRLIVTIFMYARIMNVGYLRLIPTLDDLKAVMNMLRQFKRKGQ